MKTVKIIKYVLAKPAYFILFLVFWFLTVTVFIWLLNINLLSYILASPDLSSGAKLSFVTGAYANYFRYFTNPAALSSIVFSLLAAANFTLLFYLWRRGSRIANNAKLNSGALAAMLGSHCISCGTSLLAPVLTALTGSGGAFISAQRANTSLAIATLANLIGVALIVWSIRKVSTSIARLEAT